LYLSRVPVPTTVVGRLDLNLGSDGRCVGPGGRMPRVSRITCPLGMLGLIRNVELQAGSAEVGKGSATDDTLCCRSNKQYLY
jgi:hypothetical protein